jgi:RND family efflux transporter MFP subunit
MSLEIATKRLRLAFIPKSLYSRLFGNRGLYTMTKLTFTSALFTLMILLAATGLSACKEEGASADAQAPAAPAMAGPKVTATLPVVKEVGQWEEFTGRFEAAAKVEIRARVSGYLDQIHFKDGQTVKQGDLLFTIDQRPFQASVREAEASLKSAQNGLNLATKELARSEELTKQGYSSKQTLDTKIESKQTGLANVDAARARLEQAKLDLEFTEVRAPFSGRISRHMVDVGNLVTGGAQGATLLTTVVALDPIYFYFDIDEQTYLRYSRGETSAVKSGASEFLRPVQLALTDSSNYEFAGTLDFVDTTLNEQTGTVRGRATFQNTDYTLVPGMFGRARIQGTGKKVATLIPDEAVGVDQTRNFVYVLTDNNMIGTKTVKLGGLAEGLRVVTEGLEPTDKVVFKGIQMLRDGMPVTPEMTQIESTPDAVIISTTPSLDGAAPVETPAAITLEPAPVDVEATPVEPVAATPEATPAEGLTPTPAETETPAPAPAEGQ